MLKDLINLSYRNVFRNKRRSFLSMSSVGIVAMGLMMVYSFLDGFQAVAKENLKAYTSGDFAIENVKYEKYADISPLGFLVSESDLAPILAEHTDWKTEPMLTSFTTVYQNDNFDLGVNLLGVKATGDLAKKFTILEGKFPTYSDETPDLREIAVGYSFAQINGFKLGDEIILFAQTVGGMPNAMSFKVVGILDFGADNMNGGTAISELPLVQRFLFTGDSVTKILVHLSRESLVPNTVKEIAEQFKTHGLEETYIGIPWYDTDVASLLKVQRFNSMVIGLLLFSLGSVVIVNTAVMTILERRKEIGMLRALGMRAKEVRTLFFIETTFLGILGTIVGILIGCLLTIPLAYWGIDTGAIAESAGKIQISSQIHFKITLYGISLVFGFSLLISVIVAYLSTGRVIKIQPVEAMSSN